jgi:geranylgeranyl diphosphate synthase type II
MEFKEQLRIEQELINQELEKNLFKGEKNAEGLNNAVEYSLMSTAKRLRPILIIESYKLFKDDYEKCLPYAIAMEMTHTFSLIHDDLPAIDNDDYRRGRLTCHKKFSESTAILAGDSLLNHSYMIISDDILKTTEQDELRRKIQVLNEFTNSINKMILGEYADIECEGKIISKEQVDYIHNNKTGAFFTYCLRAGAILANANEEQLNSITNYSKNIGLAFQIKDDILSETGDARIIGKPVGNDRINGKATYVTMFGLEKSQEFLNETIENAIRNLSIFGNKSEFLKNLAIYIKDRNK